MQICHFVFNFSLIQYKKLKFHLFFLSEISQKPQNFIEKICQNTASFNHIYQ